mmetsp:Transcript_7958/g.19026  ORF Transcript_7958/g.19026 Transcript_7958/m.19026 type:complete len:215 (+) Transcript_7958:578-1222(+)
MAVCHHYSHLFCCRCAMVPVPDPGSLGRGDEPRGSRRRAELGRANPGDGRAAAGGGRAECRASRGPAGPAELRRRQAVLLLPRDAQRELARGLARPGLHKLPAALGSVPRGRLSRQHHHRCQSVPALHAVEEGGGGRRRAPLWRGGGTRTLEGRRGVQVPPTAPGEPPCPPPAAAVRLLRRRRQRRHPSPWHARPRDRQPRHGRPNERRSDAWL